MCCHHLNRSYCIYTRPVLNCTVGDRVLSRHTAEHSYLRRCVALFRRVIVLLVLIIILLPVVAVAILSVLVLVVLRFLLGRILLVGLGVGLYRRLPILHLRSGVLESSEVVVNDPDGMAPVHPVSDCAARLHLQLEIVKSIANLFPELLDVVEVLVRGCQLASNKYHLGVALHPCLERGNLCRIVRRVTGQHRRLRRGCAGAASSRSSLTLGAMPGAGVGPPFILLGRGEAQCCDVRSQVRGARRRSNRVLRR